MNAHGAGSSTPADRDRWGWPGFNAGYEMVRILLMHHRIVIDGKERGPLSAEEADRAIAKIRGPYVDYFADIREELEALPQDHPSGQP